MTEQLCPDCGTPRRDLEEICPACGAPPASDLRRPEAPEGTVRQTDLEPYVALRYIARLFKILAILMAVMLIGEVVTGLATHGGEAIVTLLGEATRLLVLAGLMWAGGDITILLIDAGHDLRVSRILLGRINAQLHRQNRGESPIEEQPPIA